jgi:hypothetical protein
MLAEDSIRETRLCLGLSIGFLHNLRGKNPRSTVSAAHYQVSRTLTKTNEEGILMKKILRCVAQMGVLVAGLVFEEGSENECVAIRSNGERHGSPV